jgi:hypothetical protein
MKRRVTILRDTASPLWFIRCAAACPFTPKGADWCDVGAGSRYGSTPARGYERGVCWLYSSRAREACEQHAENCGWEVVTP